MLKYEKAVKNGDGHKKRLPVIIASIFMLETACMISPYDLMTGYAKVKTDLTFQQIDG